MPKTANDICAWALQRLNVTGIGQDPAGDNMTVAQTALESYFAELQETDGAVITWTLSEVPDAVFLPLSRYLSTELAALFAAPMPESPAKAIGRLRKALFPSDITDRRDTDGDGAISESEAEAGLRAVYF
jgi:hypothetical protein